MTEREKARLRAVQPRRRDRDDGGRNDISRTKTEVGMKSSPVPLCYAYVSERAKSWLVGGP
jgi:hypothetical protein